MANSDYFEAKKQIVKEFVEELSGHLQILEETLLDRGLYGDAFNSNQNVVVDFPDGSKMKFNYAFFLVSKTKERVAVFTEHCGYYVFHISWIKSVSHKITETFYNPDEY